MAVESYNPDDTGGAGRQITQSGEKEFNRPSAAVGHASGAPVAHTIANSPGVEAVRIQIHGSITTVSNPVRTDVVEGH